MEKKFQVHKINWLFFGYWCPDIVMYPVSFVKLTKDLQNTKTTPKKLKFYSSN